MAKMNTAPAGVKMMPDPEMKNAAVGPTDDILAGGDMGGGQDEMVTIPRMALDDAIAAFDALKAAIDSAGGGQEELPLPTGTSGPTGSTGPDNNSPDALAGEITGMRKNSGY